MGINQYYGSNQVGATLLQVTTNLLLVNQTEQ